MTSLLFAYGTLMPPDPESAKERGWQPDAVRGWLYDLGPYPALVNLDDPEAGWVEGYAGLVEADDLEKHDHWEDVDSGLYRRALTTSRNDLRVWVYVYSRPLPPGARGPLDRWRPTS